MGGGRVRARARVRDRVRVRVRVRARVRVLSVPGLCSGCPELRAGQSARPL